MPQELLSDHYIIAQRGMEASKPYAVQKPESTRHLPLARGGAFRVCIEDSSNLFMHQVQQLQLDMMEMAQLTTWRYETDHAKGCCTSSSA